MFQMMLYTVMNACLLDVAIENVCEMLYMVGGWFFKKVVELHPSCYTTLHHITLHDMTLP